MSYVLTGRARADLRGIWRYSMERWGRERADRYVREVDRAFATLAADPRRGRPCDEIRPGYRKLRGGAHMIFYRTVGVDIEVVRVLHQSMDFDRHLRGSE
jgi:toxin ParE1/3/4